MQIIIQFRVAVDRYADLFTIPTHYLVEDDEAYRTFHPSRLMGLFDMFNADSLIDLISGLGAPKRKILMSLPASAYEFTLKDQDDNAPRAPTEEMQPVIIDQKQVRSCLSLPALRRANETEAYLFGYFARSNR